MSGRDPAEGPRALVTGGAGFIGPSLVARLIQDGIIPTVVDNLSSGQDRLVDSQAPLHELDIADPALADVFAEARPEIVFHLAAQTSVARSMRDPDADIHANVLGGINVLQQCARFGTRRVVVFSTGGALYGEPEYLPCPESHPIRPLSVYGANKHTLEHYTRIFAAEAPFSHTILRPSNVYGPGQDPNGEAGVVAIFAQRMLANEEIIVYGDGEQQRDLLFVSDVVEAAIAAYKVDGGASGEFNVATGAPTSVNEIIGLLAHETGYERAPTYAPARPGEVRRIYLDATRAQKELKWAPQVSLEEGIRRTVNALRGETNGGPGGA